MVEILSLGRFHLHQNRPDLRRWVPAFLSSHKTLFTVLWLAAFASVFIWQRNAVVGGFLFLRWGVASRPIPRLRPAAFNLTDFGGVGDGVTLNTEAFQRAVYAISKLGKKGGGQLNVPPGRWLTAPFNLTSHMTLFLAEDAEILAIENEKYWPLMPPLPSYGYGREHPGPRFGSFIHGQNLKDVVITGHNGTINGQGQAWWKKYRQKLLNNTRGPLVQIMWSSDILISNITLRDSPFWTLHPYDCKNVTIRNDMVIEDCYISVGDDAIAIKSGWDQYGIAYGRPSMNILIRNLVVRSMVSSDQDRPWKGRYVQNINYRNLTFDNVRVGIVIKTDYNEHPDEGYDPKALPILKDISFIGVHGQGVRVPVRIHGSEEIPVRNITFQDMSVGLTYKKKHIFQCGLHSGRVIGTHLPAPCENLDLYDEQKRLLKRSMSQNVLNFRCLFFGRPNVLLVLVLTIMGEN
ncbi:hypothetical protein CUMW_030530 [Citrus unshiu]|nr:hypothetical protein CUMW_030530 [Citrus unshiu]